ncbi:MAG: hypothetical protein RI568_09065, partial [Natronomonas sp.]|uniref:hypothetical protein n=1 Tax=Natronomonas sp. TaxID=2184060 RepID=UPI00287042FC
HLTEPVAPHATRDHDKTITVGNQMPTVRGSWLSCPLDPRLFGTAGVCARISISPIDIPGDRTPIEEGIETVVAGLYREQRRYRTSIPVDESSLNTAPGGNKKADNGGDKSRRSDRESAYLKRFTSEPVSGQCQKNCCYESDQHQCATEPANVDTRGVRHD